MSSGKEIILFDGVCNLCNSSVRFIIRNDPKEKFQFASLQSSFAKKRLSELNEYQEDWDSLVLIRSEKVYRRSTAALLIAGELRLPWNLFSVFLILPSFLRDWFYNLISRNRYRVFGKHDHCEIPIGVTQTERFLS